MEELFGVSMNVIMVVLLTAFLLTLFVIVDLAWRNRIMLKLGLRNIPRRRAQSILIVVGIMLSTVIISAAFTTGDTISFSIRHDAVEALGTIDEIIVSARSKSDDSFGTAPYIPYQRFERLKEELAGVKDIDGLAPEIGETVPALNPGTSLTEGRMRVAGIDPLHLQGFGSFKLESGEEVLLDSLAEDEVYVNAAAAEELEARAGDRLLIFVGQGSRSVTVKGVINDGGLAGKDPSFVVPLERAQAIFDRPGQINFIVVSNRGGKLAGAALSEDVTRRLRVMFADSEVAAQISALLDQEQAIGALEERAGSLRGDLSKDLSRLVIELRRGGVTDGLIDLLADDRVSNQVLDALDRGGLVELERQAGTLLADLGELRVIDAKRRVLDEADDIGTEVTSFFIVMGLFSIMVGVLLIFLIFVMLAAARRSEMGMARAVGAKRRHLVHMYLFEGTAYALVSSAVGVLLGLGIGSLIVVAANRIFAGGGGGTPEDFQLTHHFELRSVIVAYCLGMVITFATIGISAYRVSLMNIVAAIRGLPESQGRKQPAPFVMRATGVFKALFRPLVFARGGLTSLARHSLRGFLLDTGKAVLWVGPWVGLYARPDWMPGLIIGLGALIWGADIVIALVRLIWPHVAHGWPALLLGLLLYVLGVTEEQAAPFRIGVSLIIIGAGLMIRTILLPRAIRADVRDRIAYTIIGIAMLGFWVVPIGMLRSIAGDLSADIEMFFVSGISMVAAAVWTVMYNSDLILRGLTFLTGRIGKLRPVLVTSVAYPMSAKFRTGLTLAMFALVIFTLIVMSILTEAFGSARDVDAVTGGWDIEGRVNFNTPIDDMRMAIDEATDISTTDIEALGGYTTVPVDVRQVGAKTQRWRGYALRAADYEYLAATAYRLKLIADGYGTTDREVWQALREDPRLAVVDAGIVPSRSGFRSQITPFQVEGLYYEDERMSPIDIEVREPRTGEIVQLTVIGVLDHLSDSLGNVLGLGAFTSKANIDNAVPYTVPVTTYRFRVADGVDTGALARVLESSFREHGMETDVLAEELEEIVAANRAFNYLFTGFMGLGLLVGIAALGVISLRAVVERRQQIGVLRAIGYRRRMVQLSFLLESSFVALLGIGIGVALGTTLSYLIVKDIREHQGLETLRFSIPWLQVVAIIVAAYLFSLATTLLPARQASRIYPAEALRYE